MYKRQISRIIATVMDMSPVTELTALSDVIDADSAARKLAEQIIGEMVSV